MTFHQIWLTIKHLFGIIDYDRILGHVPISGDKDYRKKVAKARERHGKQFHTHERKPRETEPSHDLLAIQDIQALLIAKQKSLDADTQQKVRKINK